jgi:hypothetical protein
MPLRDILLSTISQGDISFRNFKSIMLMKLYVQRLSNSIENKSLKFAARRKEISININHRHLNVGYSF